VVFCAEYLGAVPRSFDQSHWSAMKNMRQNERKFLIQHKRKQVNKSSENRIRRLPSGLVVVLLMILGAALFVGAYLLSLFLLLDCFEEILAVPGWVPILILVLDIVWVVLIRFCRVSHRAKVISKLVVLSVSAGALFAILCVWGLPV